MKRFQNATLEYNAKKRELVYRDAKMNGIFFAIEFSENKEIKRVFSLYPLSVELRAKVLELKFSVQNQGQVNTPNVLTMIIEVEQLNADKRTIIDVNNKELENIIFS